MKTLTRIIASLSIFLTAAACQQFDIDTQMTPEKELANLRLVCDAVDIYSFPSTNADDVTSHAILVLMVKESGPPVAT